jgi:hypothetical protein
MQHADKIRRCDSSPLHQCQKDLANQAPHMTHTGRAAQIQQDSDGGGNPLRRAEAGRARRRFTQAGGSRFAMIPAPLAPFPEPVQTGKINATHHSQNDKA